MIVSARQERNLRVELGERKYLRSERSILVPGPPEEVQLVQRAYRLVLNKRIGYSAVARELNRQGVMHHGKPWSHNSVCSLLTNPAYTGDNTWSRTSQKFHGRTSRVDPELWIRKRAAFTPIIHRRTFERVQTILEKLNADRRWSQERVLANVKMLLAEKGKLSYDLIERTDGMPSCRTIVAYFGSMQRMHELLGYCASPKDSASSRETKRTLLLRERLIADIVRSASGEVTVIRNQAKRPMLCVDERALVSLRICRSVRMPTGQVRWKLAGKKRGDEALTLLCRLNRTNDGFQSVYLTSGIDSGRSRRLKEPDPWLGRVYRLEDYSQFSEAVRCWNRL